MYFPTSSALIEFLILAVLEQGDSYGYEISQTIKLIANIKESTLYPILKKLEASGFLTTYSREFQGRMRKYYSLTNRGVEQLVTLKEEWTLYTDTVNGIIEGVSAMTRTDYLTQLETYLHKLPEADRIEAMDYFKELFDDAGPEGEEELIASLGTPKEAAHDVLSDLLDKKSMKPCSKNNRQLLHIALLALLVAPIGNSGRDRHPHGHHRYFYRGCLRHFSLFTVSVTGILLGGLFIVESFSVLVEAKSAFILIFGAGLLSIGASSLVLLGISYVARFFGLLIVRLAQWILKKEREVTDMRKLTKDFSSLVWFPQSLVLS